MCKKAVESAQKSTLPFVPIFLRKITFDETKCCSILVISLDLPLLLIIKCTYPIFTGYYRIFSQIQNLVNHYEYNVLDYLYHSFLIQYSIFLFNISKKALKKQKGNNVEMSKIMFSSSFALNRY